MKKIIMKVLTVLFVVCFSLEFCMTECLALGSLFNNESAALNPYERIEAENVVLSDGLTTAVSEDGGTYVTSIRNNGFLMVQVDFGEAGASAFTANVKSLAGGTVELRLDSVDGLVIGTLNVIPTGGDLWQVITADVSGASGVHNLYMVFKGAEESNLFDIDWWSFNEIITPAATAEVTETAASLTINGLADGSTMYVNQTVYLNVEYKDGNGNITNVTNAATYTFNYEVVDFNKDWGSLYAKSAGNTTLTATYTDSDQVEHTANLNINVKNYEPYDMVEAETCTEMRGVFVEVSGGNNPDGKNIAGVEPGDWVYYKNVDFSKGAETFNAWVADDWDKSAFEIRLDSLNGEIIGKFEKDIGNGWQQYSVVNIPLSRNINGIHDVYIVFKSSLNFDKWSVTAPVTEEGQPAIKDPFEKVQAEDEDGKQGDLREDDKIDTDDSINIGYITPGDWLRYDNVLFTKNEARFAARVASESNPCQLEVRLDSPEGVLIGSIDVPATGAWNKYVTAKCDLTLPEFMEAGLHKVYIVFRSPLNINWWRMSAAGTDITGIDPYVRVDAESYDPDDSFGVGLENCGDAGGTQNVMNIEDGDYVKYNDIDFGSGADKFIARVAADAWVSECSLEIYLDSLNSMPVGKISVPSTGGWQSYTNAECDLLYKVSGVHDVYLLFKSNLNLNWWKLAKADTTDPGTDRDDLLVYYDMSHYDIENKILYDKTNYKHNGTLCNINSGDFISDGEDSILKLPGGVSDSEYRGDNSKQKGGYVGLPKAIFDNVDLNEGFTVEAKFKPNTPGDKCLWTLGTNGENHINVMPRLGDNKMKTTIKSVTIREEEFRIISPVWTDNYNTVVVTSKGNILKTYVNGKLVSEFKHTQNLEDIFSAVDENGNIGYIGKANYDWLPYSDATITEFKIYGYALTEAEINPGEEPDVDGLLVHYDMSHDTNGLTDKSGNNKHGILHNLDSAFETVGTDDVLNLPGGSAGPDGSYVGLPESIFTGVDVNKGFSVEATFIPPEVGQHKFLWTLGTGNATDCLFVNPKRPDGNEKDKLFVGVRSHTTGGEESRYTSDPLPSGKYSTVVVTSNGNTIKTYVNGVLETEFTHVQNLNDIFGAVTDGIIGYIGKSNFESDPYCDATITDFKIYGHELTAEEIAESYTEKFRITKANVIMGKNLSLMFAFEQSHITRVKENYRAKVSVAYNDERGTVENLIHFSDWTETTIGGVPYYIVTVSNLAAKEMNDDVTVTIYYNYTPVSEPATTSLRKYAMAILKSPSSGVELKTVCVDMLNYGAAAQEAMLDAGENGYNTDNLANELLTEEQKALATKDVVLDDIRPNNIPNFVGSNIRFDSDISMLFALAEASGAVKGEIKFINHYGQEVTTEVDRYCIDTQNGNARTFEFNGMVVADINAEIHAVFKDENGNVVVELTDSLGSYCKRSETSEKEYMKALADSFSKFSTSAYVYLHR